MNQPIIRALVVDDDRSWQQIISEILTDCGLEVESAGNYEDAIYSLRTQPHRLLVVDLSLSPNDHNNHDGLRVLDAALRLDPNCRSILLTGFATVELAVMALTQYGTYTFLRKESFQRKQFREVIFSALASAPQMLKPTSTTGTSNQPPQEPLLPKEHVAPEGRALIVEDDAGWRSIAVAIAVYQRCGRVRAVVGKRDWIARDAGTFGIHRAGPT